jgi:hypothetical protein
MRAPWIAIVTAVVALFARGADAAVAPVSAEEAKEIAVDAYLYAYPLVLMDVTRQVSTNVAAPEKKAGFRAPVNQFANAQRYPDAGFTDVVRPNADTLYSRSGSTSAVSLSSSMFPTRVAATISCRRSICGRTSSRRRAPAPPGPASRCSPSSDRPGTGACLPAWRRFARPPPSAG